MIDLHGLLPTLRREVRRGATLSLASGVVALIAAGISTRLEGSAAMIPGGLALLGAVFAWFGPLVHLGADRVLGHLEFDRTLPIALRVMAAGRLLGASIRILPLFPALVALLIGFRQSSGPAEVGDVVALVVIPLVGQVVATVVLWWLMALNARWSFRRLWWLPTTIGFLPQVALMVLPASLRVTVENWFIAAIHTLTGIATGSQLVVLLLLVVVPLLIACFAGAAILFAAGLARYQFDPTQLGVSVSKGSRVELSAIGRGPLLAVARLRLRLATEQFRRELVVLVVLFLVAAFGPAGARDFARHYIPMLAALLPSGIALQLFAGRVTGELEGLQHLPHSASTVGLGYLLAIGVMALPGAVALQLLHAMSGTPPTVVAVLSSWAWFVAIAWGGAAVGLWFRRRYLIAIVVLLVAMLVTSSFLDSEDRIIGGVIALIDRYRALQIAFGPLLPFGITLMVVVVGVPLFSRGLARYTPQRA
ncbi:MAG: hypothetical protein V4558_01770 [Gemmatimonadota bacterium]